MVVMLEDEVEIILARQVEDWQDMGVIYPSADVHECAINVLGVFSLS
jgi:adenylate kinase